MATHESCGWRAERVTMPTGVQAWWCTGCLRYLEDWELDRRTRRTVSADSRQQKEEEKDHTRVDGT